MKNHFTEEHANKVLDTIVKILEDRHNVEIKYRIVERKEENDKENN